MSLFLSCYTYMTAHRTTEDAAVLIAESMNRQVVTTMELLMVGVMSTVQNMVDDQHVISLLDPDDAEGSTEAVCEWLETVSLGNEYFRDILVLDGNGVCLASSNPGHIGNEFLDMGVVKTALRGNFNQGELAIGHITRKFSVCTAGPVNVRGEIGGVLLLVADFPHIVDYDRRRTVDAQGISTSILDAEGTFVSHRDNALQGREGAYVFLYNHLSGVGASGQKVEYSLDGVHHVGFAQVEPSSKWIVITSGSHDDVIASARHMGLMVFGVCGVFFVCVGLISCYFANGVISALLSLISYARDVAGGNFDHRLTATPRKDELGTLHIALQQQVDTLQSLLVKTQKASEVKGQFLANMSHEMRTPLNAILSMAHLALRTTLDEKPRDYLEKIRTAGQSLLGLINDILDLSKIEANRLELEEIPFNLKETMQKLVSIHQETASAKHLYVNLDYPDTLPVHFIGDPLRIGQVVNNIVNNAIKFTSTGGIDIRVTRAETAPPADSDSGAAGRPAEPASGTQGDDAEAPKSCIRISVTDTGMGIAPETLKLLFTPFTQADASVTRKFGGTGLGLAISKRLVTLFGGEIDAESTPGKGTTFSFTVPLRPTSAAEVQPGAINIDHELEQLMLTGKSILIAEDNAINQVIMQEFLTPTGATMIMVDNGQQAVDAVRAQRFDLVFMDMQMPVMGGLEATRQIRTFIDKAALPIIAVTANAMKEDKEQGFAIGMNDYITKPIDPAQLLHVLQTWLPSRPPREETQ